MTTATETRKTPVKKTATPAAKKAATAKPKTAPKQGKTTAATRAEVIEELRAAGYPSGAPVSFTATTLRDALAWVKAGATEVTRGNLPNGIVWAMLPALKPTATPTPRKLSKGYVSALADVLAVLDAGGNVREFITPRLVNGEEPQA